MKDEKGALLPKKKRTKRLMDQKANSVADIAAVMKEGTIRWNDMADNCYARTWESGVQHQELQRGLAETPHIAPPSVSRDNTKFIRGKLEDFWKNRMLEESGRIHASGGGLVHKPSSEREEKIEAAYARVLERQEKENEALKLKQLMKGLTKKQKQAKERRHTKAVQRMQMKWGAASSEVSTNVAE